MIRTEWECPKCGDPIMAHDDEPLFCGSCFYEETPSLDDCEPGHVWEKTSLGWALRKVDS
jgi:hypothetical protein